VSLISQSRETANLRILLTSEPLIAKMSDSGRIDDIETNPFASLKIWRDKLQTDLSNEPDRGPDYKLRLLLEQGKGA
jgi:hypothetical protein